MSQDFPTFQGYFRVSESEVLSRSKVIKIAVIERQGTDVNALVAADAAVGDELTGQLARVNSGLFLDSARGQALTRLVFDRYGLLRKPAAAARGSVEFTTTVANPSAFDIPKDTRLQTSDGKQFLVMQSTTFPLGATGPITVAVRSALAGLGQQAQANTITNIQDVIPGAAGDLAVTNALATAGADDEESDDELVKRARTFFVNARRGTLAAIANAALEVPGVRTATAFEAIDSGGRPARFVELIVSDAFTEALVDTSPTPAAYQAQSQVLADEVAAALLESRAGGIYVRVLVAMVTLQPVQLALTFAAGADVNLAAFRARSVIVSYMNGLGPGDPFVRLTAAEVLSSVPGLVMTRDTSGNLTGAEIASPPGNVQPDILEVLRTNLGLVAAVSLQPDRMLQGNTNPDT